MESISAGSFTEVRALDEPGFGGANSEYDIVHNGATLEAFWPSKIYFQKGPVFENGVNGCHHQDLIKIVIHRLESFQKGNYACWENSIAIMALKKAVFWLDYRMNRRKKKGIMGTSTI